MTALIVGVTSIAGCNLAEHLCWSPGGCRSRRRIEAGRATSITDLAEQEGVTDASVCRLLPLTCLAPDIVEAIWTGGSRRG